MDHHLVIVLVLVPVLGVASQWVAWRLRVPAIVFLLLAGLAAGPLSGVVRPSEHLGPLLDPLVRLSVAVILFEGGLSLHLYELKEASRGVRSLVVRGVPVAFVLGSLATWAVGGYPVSESMIFGAIIVVTGPTVIMPLLRSARLERRPASLLKWEGIVNDPIGALLAVLVFEHFHAGRTPGGAVVAVIATAASALVLGLGGGALLARAFRRGLVPEYLKAPLLLAAALAAYLLADLVQPEAGLAAATVLGLALGNQRLPGIAEIRRFKEYVTILLVSAVFVLLTADLDPAALRSLGPRQLALIATLLFVVRPASIFLATAGAGLPLAERALLAWIAPRGVVAAAVAATFVPALVPLMFALIAVTVVAHGLSIGWLARRLGLAAGHRNGLLLVGASPWTTELARVLRDAGATVLLMDSSWQRLRGARMAGLPVHFGEIVSESGEESVELNDVGTLLATTGNDAYNALVCSSFAPELGRDRVFQLPLAKSDEDDPRGLSPTYRGRVAFDSDAVLDRLLRRHYRGWTFKKTALTADYDARALMAGLPDDAMMILLVRESGEIVIHTEREPLAPRPGDRVVTYVRPAEDGR